MDLKPEFVAPQFTVNLPRLGLPEDENRIATSLLVNLNGLEQQSHALAGALALIDFSEALPIAERSPWHSTLPMIWRLMAFREGATSLSNFLKSLEAVRRLVRLCPHLEPLVDLHALKEVRRDFVDRFGRVEKLRDTAAHPELYANPDTDMAGTQAPPPGKDFRYGRVPGSFHDRRYFATIAGLDVEYELSPETVLFVVSLVRKSFGAFKRVNGHSVAALLADD